MKEIEKYIKSQQEIIDKLNQTSSFSALKAVENSNTWEALHSYKQSINSLYENTALKIIQEELNRTYKLMEPSSSYVSLFQNLTSAFESYNRISELTGVGRKVAESIKPFYMREEALKNIAPAMEILSKNLSLTNSVFENSRILTYLYESIENQIDTSLWDYYDSIEENEENVDDQTVDEFVEIVQSSDVLERLKNFLREKGEKGKKLVVAAVVWLMLNFLSGLLNHYSEPIYRMLTPSFLRQEENAETVELTEIPVNTEIHVWNHTENNYIEITYQIDGQDYTGYITKEELDKNTELISSEITFEKICFINDITAVLSNKWKVTPDSVYEFLNGENNLINTYILKNYEALSLLEESALISNIEDYCEYNDIVIPVEKNDISEASE